MSSADAVDRETAWLTSYGDGLPALLAANGGKWAVIQAYMARTPGKRGNTLYVLRRQFREERFADIRRRARHEFELKLYWALSSGSGNAEADQRAFDAAVDDVVVRIGGLLQDKTHGGRFLSVAEDPRWLDVAYMDPEASMQNTVSFRASITYWADDLDING